MKNKRSESSLKSITVLTHSLLQSIGAISWKIHKENHQHRHEVHRKGSTGQDVVSGTDLENERQLRQLLKAQFSDIAFIYGEENGFERVGKGDYGALIDPIDGTRPYTSGIFYSSISVTFVDLTGKVIAGYIVMINNQSEEDASVWTFDGESVWRDGSPYSCNSVTDSLKDAVISITNVAGYSDKARTITAMLYKLIADRCRGPVSLCSGSAEILSVLEGKLSGFINFAENDIVSHMVAVEMAKSLGFYVRHIQTADADYKLLIDLEAGTISADSDLSVVVADPALKDSIDTMISDALELYEKTNKEETHGNQQ